MVSILTGFSFWFGYRCLILLDVPRLKVRMVWSLIFMNFTDILALITSKMLREITWKSICNKNFDSEEVLFLVFELSIKEGSIQFSNSEQLYSTEGKSNVLIFIFFCSVIWFCLLCSLFKTFSRQYNVNIFLIASNKAVHSLNSISCHDHWTITRYPAKFDFTQKKLVRHGVLWDTLNYPRKYLKSHVVLACSDDVSNSRNYFEMSKKSSMSCYSLHLYVKNPGISNSNT